MLLDKVLRACKVQSAGLSGASAARELGISQVTFNRWENWERSGEFPSDKRVEQIADYIGWEYDDVYIAVLAAKCGKPSIAAKLESLAA